MKDYRRYSARRSAGVPLRLGASVLGLAAAVALGPAALARAEPTPASVTFVQRNAVHELLPCRHLLSAADSRLVAVQFGVGGKPMPPIAAVAAQLHESPSAEYATVVYSLRKMEASHHRGQCQLDTPLPAAIAAAAPAATTSTRPVPRTVPATGAAAAPPTGAVRASSPNRALPIALAIALALALGIASVALVRRRMLVTGSPQLAAHGGQSGFRPVERSPKHMTTRGLHLGRDRHARDVARPRRYLRRPLLILLRPAFRHSLTRDAYVLRGVGNRLGPVLRENRRHHELPIEHVERRHAGRA